MATGTTNGENQMRPAQDKPVDMQKVIKFTNKLRPGDIWNPEFIPNGQRPDEAHLAQAAALLQAYQNTAKIAPRPPKLPQVRTKKARAKASSPPSTHAPQQLYSQHAHAAAMHAHYAGSALDPDTPGSTATLVDHFRSGAHGQPQRGAVAAECGHAEASEASGYELLPARASLESETITTGSVSQVYNSKAATADESTSPPAPKHVATLLPSVSKLAKKMVQRSLKLSAKGATRTANPKRAPKRAADITPTKAAKQRRVTTPRKAADADERYGAGSQGSVDATAQRSGAHACAAGASLRGGGAGGCSGPCHGCRCCQQWQDKEDSRSKCTDWVRPVYEVRCNWAHYPDGWQERMQGRMEVATFADGKTARGAVQASLKETMHSYEDDDTRQDCQVTQVTTAGRGCVDSFSVTREGCDEHWTVQEIDRRMHPRDLLWETTTYRQSPWEDRMQGAF